ncbi:BON domain-containing protein [Actinokineospora soli]|uniref:BON domain-containing protein n=1 Tax=Actinokineospora soli TaxID=1048753 RepID=A0ABW2TQ86_9PSEU
MTATLTRVPADRLSTATALLATVPGVDTSRVHAAEQDGAVVLVGRVQWSSEAAAIGAHLRRTPSLRDLHNRIGFHYDDDPHGRAWRFKVP